MFAIVQSGGKQYKAAEGASIRVDRLDGEVGTTVQLDEVLLVSDGETLKVGTPVVAGAKVTATITRQDKYKKIIVYKYKRRKNSSRKIGHRQHYTELKIAGISL
ncbi:50S ribosomal protein L21 [Myxococcota bacterium]|nr:50S ribosomal protein L21 [Myxococcota bacterium]MBU1535539.1 50S ribosomal protein L21 [Myxococcota bacterium]